MKKLMCLTYICGFILLQWACSDEDKVENTLSNITLLSPAETGYIDLNDVSIAEYLFSWKESGEEAYSLILSNNAHLQNDAVNDLVAFSINAGAETTLKITGKDADICFAKLKISEGATGTVYWTVRPTADTKIAATEIRPLSVTRKNVFLSEPANQEAINLDADHPNTLLKFSWGTHSQPEGAKYVIRMSLHAGMSGTLVSIPAGTGNSVTVSHEQIQTAIETLSPPSDLFQLTKIYWNVFEVAGNTAVSPSPGILNVRPMMRFKDVRGNETIVYKVVEIYVFGTGAQYWLAENLRATKYPNGSDIPLDKHKFASAGKNDLPQGYETAYGGYYHYSIKRDIAPKGWRLPTFTEIEKVYRQAGIEYFTYNALKSPVFYSNGIKADEEYVNEMGLNLVAAGQIQQSNGSNLANYNRVYCYLLATGDTDESKCANHDGGATIWHSSSEFTPGRFILVK